MLALSIFFNQRTQESFDIAKYAVIIYSHCLESQMENKQTSIKRECIFLNAGIRAASALPFSRCVWMNSFIQTHRLPVIICDENNTLYHARNNSRVLAKKKVVLHHLTFSLMWLLLISQNINNSFFYLLCSTAL